MLVFLCLKFSIIQTIKILEIITMNKITSTLVICLLSMLSLNSYALSIKLHPDLIDSSSQHKSTTTEFDSTNEVSEEYEGGDLFPGTIKKVNNQYVLTRCTSGGYDYVLKFTKSDMQNQIDELLQSNNKFWINVFGVYFSVGDEHHLKVKDISDIHRGQTCHLSDALDDLFK